MVYRSDPRENRLLAALPEAAWLRLRPALTFVPLSSRQVLHESAQPLTHAYFPTSAVISMMVFTQEGESVESAVVGNDGMVGISLLTGGDSGRDGAMVQTDGCCYRIPAQVLKDEFNRAGPFMQVMLRYSQALLTQTAQLAVCNRHHSLAQQLARFLLCSLDQAKGSDLVMTQERIADRLGVRRESVTAGAYLLQKLGVIRYTRGHICVLDRDGLEQRSCECYAVVKQTSLRLFPEPIAERLAA